MGQSVEDEYEKLKQQLGMSLSKGKRGRKRTKRAKTIPDKKTKKKRGGNKRKRKRTNNKYHMNGGYENIEIMKRRIIQHLGGRDGSGAENVRLFNRVLDLYTTPDDKFKYMQDYMKDHKLEIGGPPGPPPSPPGQPRQNPLHTAVGQPETYEAYAQFLQRPTTMYEEIKSKSGKGKKGKKGDIGKKFRKYVKEYNQDINP